MADAKQDAKQDAPKVPDAGTWPRMADAVLAAGQRTADALPGAISVTGNGGNGAGTWDAAAAYGAWADADADAARNAAANAAAVYGDATAAAVQALAVVALQVAGASWAAAGQAARGDAHAAAKAHAGWARGRYRNVAAHGHGDAAPRVGGSAYHTAHRNLYRQAAPDAVATVASVHADAVAGDDA